MGMNLGIRHDRTVCYEDPRRAVRLELSLVPGFPPLKENGRENPTITPLSAVAGHLFP